MRFVIYILLSLVSLTLSILFFGTLVASCSGHPPKTTVGIWIIPLSLLGAGIFFNLSIFLWRARGHQAPGLLKKEARLLPKKTFIFLCSFVAGSIAFILLSSLIYALEINTMLPDLVGYILVALYTLIAIYIGIATYRRLTKNQRQTSQTVPPDRQ